VVGLTLLTRSQFCIGCNPGRHQLPCSYFTSINGYRIHSWRDGDTLFGRMIPAGLHSARLTHHTHRGVGVFNSSLTGDGATDQVQISALNRFGKWAGRDGIYRLEAQSDLGARARLQPSIKLADHHLISTTSSALFTVGLLCYTTHSNGSFWFQKSFTDIGNK
jgi:hypothetical protein